MKVGVVIVTHYGLGAEFVQALRLIVPEAPTFYAVSLEPNEAIDEMRAKLGQTLQTADQGDGVLVLTDMFGGTPSNISLSFLDDFNIEVVTGFNLPMLIKLATQREEMSVGDLAHYICEYGRRNLSCASELVPHGAPE